MCFFVLLLTGFADLTTTATLCCTHDEKDRNDVEKGVGGIFCSPFPHTLPSLSTVLSFLLGTGQGDLDTMNGGKGKHWVWLKGI